MPDSEPTAPSGDGHAARRPGLAARLALAVIRLYRRYLSPLLPPSCRYEPTCSQFALTAIERFGLLSGGWLAVRRIARCHPWHPGGWDPVPEPHGERSAAD